LAKILAEKFNFDHHLRFMKDIIEKLKTACAAANPDFDQIVSLLKELREYFKANLNEPGLVKMIRLAYENIEENGTYTFLYLEDGDAKENISYLIDLLADHTNKYNKEELQDIRNLMEGIEIEDDEIEEEEA
jgi:hypothetical protein